MIEELCRHHVEAKLLNPIPSLPGLDRQLTDQTIRAVLSSQDSVLRAVESLESKWNLMNRPLQTQSTNFVEMTQAKRVSSEIAEGHQKALLRLSEQIQAQQGSVDKLKFEHSEALNEVLYMLKT